MQTLSPIQIPAISKDLDEQLRLAHRVVDVVDCPNGKICLAILRHNVGNPEGSYVQIRVSAKKKKEENFQKTVYLNFKPEETLILADVMNSVYKKSLIFKLNVLSCKSSCK